MEPVVTQKALGFVVRFFEGRGASIKNKKEEGRGRGQRGDVLQLSDAWPGTKVPCTCP